MGWFCVFTLWLSLWVLCCRAQHHQQRFYFKRQDKCPGRVLSEDSCPDTVRTRTKSQCGVECGQRAGCLSFVWDPDSRLCRLCDSTVTELCDNTRPAQPRQHALELRCQSPEERSTSELCRCPSAWDGPRCQNRMTDCSDWKSAGFTDNGARWIQPALSPRPFLMMCHMNWDRGLILSRWTLGQDFYRNWRQYAEGFGEVSGDHWLGLRKVHQMTQSRCYRLAIQVNLANGTNYQRKYRNFTVSGEDRHFAVDFGTSFLLNSTLGDCLSDVRQKPFSTYDADHDDDVAGSCAERHHSGWWFGNCTLCNPTGELTWPANMSRTSDKDVFWTPGFGDLLPQGLIMMLRRC